MSGLSLEAPSGKGRTDENFPVGSRLIRASLRPHVHAFYAFARNADDIADSPILAAADKLDRLDAMAAILLGRDDAASPATTRLCHSLAATGVTPQHALDLLRAFKQDATKTRYATWDELLDYCRYSAMPVGRHVLELHGETRATWAASDALCAALQVLNHLQDCARDLAELDRCYLPASLLADACITVDAVRAPAASPGLRQVLDALLDHTDALNRTASNLPGLVADRFLRTETAVIAGLAQRLARRLRRGDPLARRVKLRGTDVAASVLLALPRLR